MNAAAVDGGGWSAAALPLVLSARNTRTLITVFTRTSWGPLANGGQDVVTPATVNTSGELALQTGSISPTDRFQHEQFYIIGSMLARPGQGRAGSQAANKTK